MFSAQARQHFEQAQGFGHLANPTHQRQCGEESQGHFFLLQLQLEPSGIVQDLAFYCPRCLPAIACGGFLYRCLYGGSLRVISTQEILEALGGLPPQRSFYAWMASKALQEIYEDWSS